ncbi:MAG: hypothetical protein KVP17_003277 [Porospora cf. gigantea B]|uniref:uncharacterized protein n=1 Tax=Porospora cf. gigantea B TaxID=2853592 RepID=UPI003571BABF|nr:MAG: hypothetical protein KVP17_003277 [Porospora cf. gigantea B]
MVPGKTSRAEAAEAPRLPLSSIPPRMLRLISRAPLPRKRPSRYRGVSYPHCPCVVPTSGDATDASSGAAFPAAGNSGSIGAPNQGAKRVKGSHLAVLRIGLGRGTSHELSHFALTQSGSAPSKELDDSTEPPLTPPPYTAQD